MKRRNRLLKLIRKLVTGLMILLVALGSSPLEVFAYVTDSNGTEWPTINNNGTASTLPQPPADEDIVDLSRMFNYPILDYSRIPLDPTNGQILDFSRNKSYVTSNDSSVAVLTRDSTWQSGVMWSLDNYKVQLDEPFHMISYVYLGNKGQQNRGADGITFTMHNDNKVASSSEAGSIANTGNNAYGALGNGLGVYGSHFSGADNKNIYVQMTQGVTNGIALEFDTFYNDETNLKGKQFSDNDLWGYVRRQGSDRSNFGHIGINYLNNLQQNRANEDYTTLQPNRYKTFSTDVYDYNTMIKHSGMLAVGWDGTITKLDPENGWQIGTNPSKPLADDKWHRLEVKWQPTSSTTGNLTYLIYRDGHNGVRNVHSIDDTLNDGSNVLTYTIENLDVQSVFAVSSTADSVYWGFSGSTGGFQNNQAVQMLQLPVNYYTSELSKLDQDKNPVSDAEFQIEKKDDTTGEWIVQEFYNPYSKNMVSKLLTGSEEDYIGIYGGVDRKLGSIRLTQLTKGTYRWKEVAPAEGYQLDQVYYPDKNGFVVNYAESQKENAFQYTAKNTKLYQLELTKKDSDTQRAIDGVPFIISKTENDKQYYLKLNADTTGFEWTEVEAKAEQFLSGKSYALDETGKISGQAGDAGKLIVKYFPDAPNLSWKEVSAPAGYDSSGTMDGSFSTPVDNKYLYQATQTNSRLYQVSLEKKASDTNLALPGAVFSLQKKVDQNWETVSQDGVSEFTTNSEGKITISNLTAGSYRWEEKQAPVGYKIKQQYYPDENDGFEVKYREGLKIDEISQNYIYDPNQVVTNEPQDFELILEKLSSTFQRPLENVSFTLYGNREGNTFSNEIWLFVNCSG